MRINAGDDIFPLMKGKARGTGPAPKLIAKVAGVALELDDRTIEFQPDTCNGEPVLEWEINNPPFSGWELGGWLVRSLSNGEPIKWPIEGCSVFFNGDYRTLSIWGGDSGYYLNDSIPV